MAEDDQRLASIQNEYLNFLDDEVSLRVELLRKWAKAPESRY